MEDEIISLINNQLKNIQKEADILLERRSENITALDSSDLEKMNTRLDTIESYDVRVSKERSRLEQLNLTYEELFKLAVDYANSLDFYETAYEVATVTLNKYEDIMNSQQSVIDELNHRYNSAVALGKINSSIKDKLHQTEKSLEKHKTTSRTRAAANARHSKPGGSKEKHEEIRRIWASGKYTSRDICAEQECAGLNISFATARKALRNTPAPS